MVEPEKLLNSNMKIMFLHIQGTENWKNISQVEKKEILKEIYIYYNSNNELPSWLQNILNTDFKKFPELVLPLRK